MMGKRCQNDFGSQSQVASDDDSVLFIVTGRDELA
jgi:hypothetical protein